MKRGEERDAHEDGGVSKVDSHHIDVCEANELCRGKIRMAYSLP